MIAAGFDYSAPETLSDALKALADDPEAKVLASEQSLIRIMKLRLAAPSQVVDLGGIADLHFIVEEDGVIRIGSMTTHEQVENSDLLREKCPLLAAAAGTRCRAEKKGDHWLLNGSRTFTTNAHIADVCVAMAVTNPNKAEKGISAFVIEKGTEGFRVSRKENKLGMRASVTGEVLFENCKLPLDHILGAPGRGFTGAMRTLDGGRISISALSVGLAQGAYEASLNYARQREQFGQKISEFQAIQHKLADMAPKSKPRACSPIRPVGILTKDAG